MVQMTGLEPTRETSLPPQSSASANSATSAIFVFHILNGTCIIITEESGFVKGFLKINSSFTKIILPDSIKLPDSRTTFDISIW